jgi:hypothetical protein
VRAKNLRVIPRPETLLGPPARRVLHAVMDSDRLDLLAFKYYNDTTRWWQISDVNPQYAFPVGLLDERPFVEEVFLLAHVGFSQRYVGLTAALAGFGSVLPQLETSFDGEATAEQGFVEASVLMTYTTSPATRQSILNEIQSRGFQLLRAFAWSDGPNTTEAFTFEDRGAKGDWQSLTGQLAELPGVARLVADLTGATLVLTYNATTLRRESLLALMKSEGFAMTSTQLTRVGDKVLIPPSQIV